MKTRLKGTIKNIKREGVGDVRIDFNAHGTVQGARGNPDAREVTLDGSLVLRAIHADAIRFGQSLTITVDGEDVSE